MYESRDSMPWYQSEDLDFDAACAEWERQRQADGWADYVADMVERQAADDAELLALLDTDEARQGQQPALSHSERGRGIGERGERDEPEQ